MHDNAPLPARRRFSNVYARLLIGVLSLEVPFAFLILAIGDPDGPPQPVWLSVVAWLFLALSLLISIRIFAMRVTVRPDGETVVHGAFVTARVLPGQAQRIEMPDREPTGAIPRLIVSDGRRIRLTPLVRVKNRAWGADKSSIRGTRALAERLDVPIGGDEAAAARHRFG